MATNVTRREPQAPRASTLVLTLFAPSREMARPQRQTGTGTGFELAQACVDLRANAVEHLYYSSAGPKGHRLLAEALPHNSSLVCLELTAGVPMNGMGDSSTLALAQALQTNSTLTELHITVCPSLRLNQGEGSLTNKRRTKALESLVLKHSGRLCGGTGASRLCISWMCATRRCRG